MLLWCIRCGEINQQERWVAGGLCCTAPGRSGDVLDIFVCCLPTDLGSEGGVKQDAS